MAKFKVSAAWTEYGSAIVEAENIEDARNIASELPLDQFSGDYSTIPL